MHLVLMDFCFRVEIQLEVFDSRVSVLCIHNNSLVDGPNERATTAGKKC